MIDSPAEKTHPLQELRAQVCAAATAVRGPDGELPVPPRLERSRREGQGDYSTNAAMLLAPVLGAAPRVIAERLAEELTERLGDDLESAEVAGPGFLNLTLSSRWHRRALDAVLAAGTAFGGGGAQPAERILIEFVSANPTGPLVAASGRHAAYGDALARILEHHGHAVCPRVLLQRRRQPDPAAGRVGPGPGAGGGGPRGRLPGRVRRASSRSRSRAPPSVTPTSWPPRRSRSCWAGSRRRSSATACAMTGSSASARCTRDPRAGSSARSRCSSARATPTAPTARCGCGRLRSATTRTAWWSARTASRPTWRPTSPICRTSASAGSSASCCRSAPTITPTHGS